MPQMIKQSVIKCEGIFSQSKITANIFNHYPECSVFHSWERNGVFWTKINLQLSPWHAVYLHLDEFICTMAK